MEEISTEIKKIGQTHICFSENSFFVQNKKVIVGDVFKILYYITLCITS
jgi:hypothetical protein